MVGSLTYQGTVADFQLLMDMERLYAITLLLVLATFSGAQLQSSAERPCPGETVTFTCTISSLAHDWMVPSLNISRALLSSSMGVFPDPPFEFVVTQRMGTTVTESTAVVTVNADLNGTLVLCRDAAGVVPEQNSTINLRAPLIVPGTPTVSFPIPREQFTISWDEPTLYMNETIDGYFVNISGPNDLCGNDSNNTPQMVTERSYTCTIQTTPQQGAYTFTVAAVNCGGNLRGPESEPVRLQVPDTPSFTLQPDCPGLSFADINWQNTVTIMPNITEVCVNCTGENCTYECRPVSGNNLFRINNIVPGENYTISVSLRNDFGQSGQSAPELYVNNDEQCPPTSASTTSIPPTQPPSPTPTSSPTPTQPPPQASSDAGAIAGGVIGGLIGVIIIALIVIVIAYLIWKKKNSPKPKKSKDIKPKEQSPGNVDRNGHNPTTTNQGHNVVARAPSGEVYTVTDKSQGDPQPAEAGGEDTTYDILPKPTEKPPAQEQEGLKYTEIGFTTPGEATEKEAGMLYSDLQNV